MFLVIEPEVIEEEEEEPMEEIDFSSLEVSILANKVPLKKEVRQQCFNFFLSNFMQKKN